MFFKRSFTGTSRSVDQRRKLFDACNFHNVEKNLTFGSNVELPCSIVFVLHRSAAESEPGSLLNLLQPQHVAVLEVPFCDVGEELLVHRLPCVLDVLQLLAVLRV